MIEDTLANEVGAPVRGRLEVQEIAPAAAGRASTRSWACRPRPPPNPSPKPVLPGRGGRESPAVQLDSKFTFETFVAASSNRLAHAAAQAVAETPGRSYNPLFIYGDSGLGKTHLLHAIGNYVTENFPRRKVLLRHDRDVHERLRGLHCGPRRPLAFKRRYRDCDVLLIDDVQFMERKEGLQEEFFHTYNDLKGASKQIVLTSDRPPKSIETLEDRLRSRFLSGLDHRDRPARPRDPPGHSALQVPERAPGGPRRRPGVHRLPREGQHPGARGGAHPHLRLRQASTTSPSPSPRPSRSSRTSCWPASRGASRPR